MAMTVLDILSKIDSGHVIDEANTQIAAVAKSVEQTEGKGRVTITLLFEHNNANQLLISASVKSAAPATAHGQSVFFTDDRGGLHRKDPFQGELALREVG